MFKYFIIFCVLICVCLGDDFHKKNHKIKYIKKKHHFPHHLIYAGFTYLAFLAIKFKIIFFFGIVFAVLCAGGKIFAFIKYLEKGKHPEIIEHSPEKIYIQPPSHGYDFSSGPVGPPGDDGFSGAFQDYPPHDYDKLDSYYPPSYGKGRNNDDIYGEFEGFTKMLKTANFSDLAFDKMNMTTLDCRKRFVCESDYNMNKITILKAGYDMLNDESYTKYRTKTPVESLEKCEKLYPDCEDFKQKSHF
ncbi:unnamed protein product [Brassicogethes aeneus]|uniref:Uncharacterized protein n=1 Tax=Brassicogethes aeneus TaxID=1431903 RepID=A0A9P0FCN6_BRAAE|nr:unnamed protein product [Brassicogethes aeneus]